MSSEARPRTADGVPVRPAATVILIDDNGAVFTFRRRRSLIFAAGMVVFPGGRCESADAELAATVPGADAQLVAAVRETFEECGVLVVDGAPNSQDLMRQRRRLQQGTPFAVVLRELGVRLEPALLHPWSRWVTPEGEVRRYDTMFYVAALPAGQSPAGLDSEGEDAAWFRPADALRLYQAGELPMLTPTITTLRELDGLESAAAAFAVERVLDPVRLRAPL